MYKIMQIKNFLSNLIWNFENCFYYRFNIYEDDIDRCAFFCQLNSGWHKMYGDLDD